MDLSFELPWSLSGVMRAYALSFLANLMMEITAVVALRESSLPIPVKQIQHNTIIQLLVIPMNYIKVSTVACTTYTVHAAGCKLQ